MEYQIITAIKKKKNKLPFGAYIAVKLPDDKHVTLMYCNPRKKFNIGKWNNLKAMIGTEITVISDFEVTKNTDTGSITAKSVKIFDSSKNDVSNLVTSGIPHITMNVMGNFKPKDSILLVKEALESPNNDNLLITK